MIPAILSCVFVLYLYRTLDAENSSDTAAASNSQSSSQISLLHEQLASLRTRLEKLTQAPKGGDQ